MVGAFVSFELFFLFRFEGDKMRVGFWLVKQKEWWTLIRIKPHDCSTFYSLELLEIDPITKPWWTHLQLMFVVLMLLNLSAICLLEEPSYLLFSEIRVGHSKHYKKGK